MLLRKMGGMMVWLVFATVLVAGVAGGKMPFSQAMIDSLSLRAGGMSHVGGMSVSADDTLSSPRFASISPAMDAMTFLNKPIADSCLDDTSIASRLPGVFRVSTRSFIPDVTDCWDFIGEGDDGVVAKLCLKDLDPNTDPDPVVPQNSAVLFEFEKMGPPSRRFHKLKVGADHFCESLAQDPNAPNVRFRRNRKINRKTKKTMFTMRIPLRVIKTKQSDCCRGPSCFVAEVTYRNLIPVAGRSEIRKAYIQSALCSSVPDDPVPFCPFALTCTLNGEAFGDCRYNPPTNIVLEVHYNQPSRANPSFVELRTDIYTLEQGNVINILGLDGELLHAYSFRGKTLTPGSPRVTIEEKEIPNTVCFKGIVFTWRGGQEVISAGYTILVTPQALSDVLVFKIGGDPQDFETWTNNLFSIIPPWWFDFFGGLQYMISYAEVDPAVPDQSLVLVEEELFELSPVGVYFGGYFPATKTPDMLNNVSDDFGFPLPTPEPTATEGP